MLLLPLLGTVTPSASRTDKEFVFAMSHCPEANLAAVTSDSLPCAATYTAVLAADTEDLRDLMLCPGGMPFGVKFYTDGVTVVGFCDVDTGRGSVNPAARAGLRAKDVILKINGEVYEEAKTAARRGFGRRGGVEYKSFNIVKGETYDIVIEYKRGTGNFAMLNADICERRLIEFDNVAKDVADADVIIVIGGISAQLEGEGGDKADIELPEVQQRLIRAMKATGKPVVVVNCSGSAIAFGSVKGQYDALLQAWYPGQGGSQALAEVIFGDYNPGGKLPVTFYESTKDLPDFLDYSMENRTYRYFRGVPQYAFGYGLSYTTFEVGKGKISKKSMKTDGSVKITVPVENTGDREGTETIQVYVKALDYAEAPIKSLKGFQKINLKAGEKGKVEIVLDGESFQYYDPSIDELSTRTGRYQILYGTSSLEKDLKSIDFVVK